MSTLQELLISLKNRDIKISVNGESIVVDAPPGAMDTPLSNEIKKHKNELISLFTSQNSASKITATNNIIPVELSTGQKRIWDLAQLNPNSSQYNIPTVFKIVGNLDCDKLIKSVDKACQINKLLLSYIDNSNVDSIPTIRLIESFKMPYTYFDINDINSKNNNADSAAREYCYDFTQQNFEFKKNQNNTKLTNKSKICQVLYDSYRKQ